MKKQEIAPHWVIFERAGSLAYMETQDAQPRGLFLAFYCVKSLPFLPGFELSPCDSLSKLRTMAMIVSLEIPIPTFTGKDPLQSTIVTSFADPRPGQNAQPLTTTLYVAFTSPTPPQTMTTIPVTLPALTSSASAVPTPPSSTVPPASSSSPGGPFVPHSPAGNGNGISGGAVAGVAIGCLIAGAVITFIACFFLYRRRNQKYPEPYIQSHLPYDTEQKSGAAVRTAPLPSAGIAARSSLPQPAEDAAISKEVSKIRDNIKNHVQNFYHYQPVHRGIGGAELTALAAATNLDPSVVETMLANPSTRSDTIRLFIAWAILSRCEGQRQPTLLPCELAPILETVAGQGGKDNGESILAF